MNGSQERYTTTREAFGRWLLAQRDRGDWVDGSVQCRSRRSRVSQNGDPEAVRAYLRNAQADGDTFQAIDDAELDWLSL